VIFLGRSAEQFGEQRLEGVGPNFDSPAGSSGSLAWHERLEALHLLEEARALMTSQPVPR
jgi:hypothetical protein